MTSAGDALASARALWVVHHDYSGLARAKVIPPDRFDEVMRDGVRFGLAAWDYTFAAEQVPDSGYGLETGDYRVVPDADSVMVLPHVDGVAQVVGALCLDGEPWEGDPRGRVRRAVEALAELGVLAKVALEVEFLVAAPDESGQLGPIERGPMYGTDALEGQWGAWAGAAFEGLVGAGLGVHQFAREGSPSQFELSLLPTDPVAACDRYLVARQILKGLVERPAVATLMPKPFADLAGNGLHVHISLEREDGTSLIPDPSDPTALSDGGLAVIAGLLRQAAGQCALGAATPNSYARLVPGSGSPTYATWSFGNRSALVRIPGAAEDRRIEYRTGDPSANVYLHVAGILATIVKALRSPPTAAPAVDRDLGLLDAGELATLGATQLPTSLEAALDALEADAVVADALGDTIMSHYVPLKRLEADLRRRGADADDPLAWDRARYLEAL